MDTKDYSDLEVVMMRQSMMMADEKVVISKLDEATSGSFPTTPAPAYVAPVPMATAVPVVPPSRTNSEAGSSFFNTKTIVPQRKEKTILGLKKRVFILTAVGSAMLLILILGLAIGLTAGKAKGSNDTGSQTIDQPGTGILNISSLAATNWTDNNNVGRAAVFYQDRDNALNVMLFDSLSGGWTRRNVTASVMNSSSIPSLDVMPGTPLACVTNKFQVSLYYLQRDNTVSEVYSPNPVNGDWLPGALNPVLNPQASSGSRLAAYWQVCPSCTDTLLLAYEGNGVIQLANSTRGQWQSMPAITKNVLPGSGLSMNPFTDFNGSGSTGTDANALRVYQSADDNLIELISGPLTDRRWEVGNFGNALTSNLPTKPAPAITSLSFGSTGWTESLTTYLTNDGRLVSAHWNGSTWAARPPNLDQTYGNATAIASTQAQRIYTIVDGAIHQYRVDAATDPFKWFHINRIAG
ncbi:fungal fucose-specific lectin protein [Colletotrichum tofieldiae]|uniref:Fungal fucose-specific lectin protein n=1 Tax=Colletotrichum tofieldiae TaxID=708197 RepID=A0A166QRM2_9PEZI|nr:fungal fucose-specific lectin protein [Colletotrichum tofieldiae]